MFSPGSVVVARNGKPIFQNAYGLASKAYNIPNRIDTKFNLGSMNKMFTAVAIAQLVEQGKLSFDDTGARSFPTTQTRKLPLRSPFHHLLTHTSGLSDYFTPRFLKHRKTDSNQSRTICLYLWTSRSCSSQGNG